MLSNLCYHVYFTQKFINLKSNCKWLRRTDTEWVTYLNQRQEHAHEWVKSSQSVSLD